jgi:hypothetical protein
MNRFAASLAVASLLLAPASRPSAEEPADVVIPLDAGLACEFALQLEIWGSEQHRVDREFVDPDGNLVRVLSAGVGNTLRLTNLETGTSLTFEASGAVEQVTPNGDGTDRHVLTGHNLVIFFPTDTPAGPSTTLHVGRFVLDADAQSNFTFVSATGRTTDVCAALR